MTKTIVNSTESEENSKKNLNTQKELHYTSTKTTCTKV